MSAGRALLRTLGRRRARAALVPGPPVFWGRVGAYEAVTRQGILFLLSPDPAHPSRLVAGDIRFPTDVGARSSAGS